MTPVLFFVVAMLFTVSGGEAWAQPRPTQASYADPAALDPYTSQKAYEMGAELADLLDSDDVITRARPDPEELRQVRLEPGGGQDRPVRARAPEQHAQVGRARGLLRP